MTERTDQIRAAEGESPEALEQDPPKGPVRTCVGCQERIDTAGGESLVRLILGPDGEIAVDLHGRGGFGRGAHVHPRPGCISAAAKTGLSRAAKRSGLTVCSSKGVLPLGVGALAAAIREAAERRVLGLLGSASRARAVALGADAVMGACHRGEAPLLIVASDAAAAAKLSEVQRAVAEGRAVAWGTKQELGELFRKGTGASGVGVVAILSESIAAAVQEAAHIASVCASAPAATGDLPRSPRAPRGAGGRPARNKGSRGPKSSTVVERSR